MGKAKQLELEAQPRYPFRTQYRGPQAKGESFVGELSRTVPDMSYTIKEILKRFASGLPLEGMKVPVYQEEEIDNLPDMAKMDIAEKEEYIRQTNERVQELKKELNKMAQQRKAAKERSQNLEFLEWKKSKETKDTKPASDAGK